MIAISFMLQTRALRNAGKWRRSIYGAKKDFTICNVNWFLVGILLHIFSLFFRLTNAEVLNRGIRKQHIKREMKRWVMFGFVVTCQKCMWKLNADYSFEGLSIRSTRNVHFTLQQQDSSILLP